jgi:hypothetical protein
MRRLLLPLAAIAALTTATAAFGARNDTTYFYFHATPVVARTQQEHVVLQPAPTGLCRITVSNGRIRMRAKRVDRWGLGLYPKRSLRVDDRRIAWTWTVEPTTPLGRWRIRIRCGSARPLQTEFRVIRYY